MPAVRVKPKAKASKTTVASGPKTLQGNSPSATNIQTLRTTIIIPATFDLNLEVCRIRLCKTGRLYSKNDVIKIALEEFIAKNGQDPRKNPDL